MTFTLPGATYAELNAVLDQARRRQAHTVPVTEAQLLALQRRWTAALTARLDQALEDAAPGDEAAAVAQAWRTLAEEQPTLRALLDAHEPALGAALRTEYRALALAAGLVGLDTPAAEAERAGRQLRDRIRASAGNGRPDDRPDAPQWARRAVCDLAHIG